MKILVTFIAALVPMVVGFIWYNPKVFGTIWMNETGMTPEKGKSANMAKTFGLTFLLSLMMAFILQTIVIHQSALQSLVMNDTSEATKKWLADAMSAYGNNFRTFKHGMLHGFIAGLFIVLPAIGVGSLFEQRSGKYIWIAAGFWMVSMMIMGGIICQWG
jgi:Protein of unknown function (DUF1761)